MEKEEALKMIDDHKNSLINPVEMLDWTYLRLYILNITDDAWDNLTELVIKDAST